mmetsp:Transcript_8344/g.21217  ORF Transcript_8344/g.21217 Transcript_8344/m.21217 type:complete len:296 (+) Transcript_8344:82-969(+)|eukprot:CAMPEP_0117580362 /NCGR_PEP_ID=MMETSP0784-20121206/65157_1 /TAXON_ID=39447 /ORGANISM="" /LENGTH=295 /DNA_ID=CAMNT_0005380409 /DNA_START=56 /DNA_END=943 /DNA_ORIENTATION=+
MGGLLAIRRHGVDGRRDARTQREQCRQRGAGGIEDPSAFNYNLQTGESSWEHPDQEPPRLIDLRERAKNMGQEALVDVSARWAMSGEVIVSVQLLTNNTVRVLRQEVAKASGNDRDSCALKLLFDGRVLSETATLAEIGVQNDATVEVVRSNCATAVELSLATMRILKGSRAEKVLVGTTFGADTFAQNPPAKNDAWEIQFVSELTTYDVIFEGGSNPYHGIFTVSIDGELVGEVDQYSQDTCYPTRHMLRWQAAFAGKHVLGVCVHSKNPEAHGFWVCLSTIRFQPVDFDDAEP